MKYAVLGAGGCFGMNLTRYLLTEGHEVIGVGRSPMKATCFSMDLAHPKRGFQYHVYSVGPDSEFILELLDAEKPEVIVNFAAQGEGAASFKRRNVKYFYRTNGSALIEFAEELAARPWLKRFIHIGSSEVYGSVTTPSTEAAPTNPTSKYANSKLVFDNHLLCMAREGFPVNIVRPSNCYTPGQQLHRVIPRAMLAAVTGGEFRLEGGGTAEKSYLHATDLSAAIALIAEKAPFAEIYNCGPKEPISIYNLVQLCAISCGVLFDKFVKVVVDRPGQDARYWLDSSKLEALGWTPKWNFNSGLFGMYSWVNAYKDELKALPADFRMRA